MADKLKLIDTKDTPKELIQYFKFENIPNDFKLRIGLYNFYKTSNEMVSKEFELDPTRFTMYRNSNANNTYILIDNQEKVLELHLNKKSGKLTEKVASLANAISRWKQ